MADPKDPNVTGAIPNHVNILQAVIDATPDAVFVKDLEGRYLLVNAVTAAFLGKSPAEFVGKFDTDLYSAETAAKYDEADRAVLRSGETKVFEDITTLGDVPHEYLVTKKVYRDQDGNIAGVLGVSRDITARKRAEAAIKHSVEYRNLFVLANDPIVIFEPDSQIVIDVNDKACEAYGFSREAFIGRSFKTLSQDVQDGEARWAQLLVAGTVPAFEAVQFRSDGTPVAFLISASLIDYRGRKAVLSINRDITERRRIAAELEETRDAALESVRLKSEFLANMSHEIRTPMNGIIGMTDLTLDTKLTVKQREYLGMVKASADSLLGVVNDILDFSKIEAGKLRLEPIAFDLQDSVGDAMKTLALRAHEKGLELTYYVAPDVPSGVVGDPDRIRQILVNLVSNAIKFTRSGEVSVRIETAAAGDGASLHFSVTDTGIGIPREKQALIFEPFAQADGSITRQYGGTGLGLAITTQLIDLMEGRLWVESPVEVHGSEGGGPGSAFHFVIPLRSAPMSDASPPITAWPVHDLPVLIVDDNRTNRRILQEALFNWQMHPTAVESGRAALDEMSRAAAAGRPFSLVLLDAHMPEMDGFSVAAEIRRTPAIADATIMMLSSVGEHIYAGQLQPLRLAAYFTKPIKLSELRTAILHLLDPLASEQRDRRQTARAPVAAQGRRLHVLVVEDTFINQQLALALLAKRGYTTELAVNGKEALVALEQRRFDLVLMDVQMPEMNGLEATARIRDGEQPGVRLPIVAMTAHAMKGDRERCLDTGMDAYIAKPIRADELWETIERLVPAGCAINETAGAQPPPPGVGAFDHAALLSCAHGDLNLAHELADIFLATSPGLLAEIHGAVARADGDTLERAAHSMKSAISYFANAAGIDAAAKLEKMGCTGELASANIVAAALEQNVESLVAALGTFKKESAS